MNEQAPVVDPIEVPTVQAPAAEAPKAEAKPSPAQDLRNIQMLIVSGIFPGNVAPQVVAAYQLLEKMAQKVEEEHRLMALKNAEIDAKKAAKA